MIADRAPLSTESAGEGGAVQDRIASCTGEEASLPRFLLMIRLPTCRCAGAGRSKPCRGPVRLRSLAGLFGSGTEDTAHHRVLQGLGEGQ